DDPPCNSEHDDRVPAALATCSCSPIRLASELVATRTRMARPTAAPIPGAGGHDCCGDTLLRIVHAGSGGDEHAREHNTIGDADGDRPRRERAVGAVR